MTINNSIVKNLNRVDNVHWHFVHTHCRVRSLTSLTSSALGVLDKGNGKKHWVKGWKVLQVCAAF